MQDSCFIENYNIRNRTFMTCFYSENDLKITLKMTPGLGESRPLTPPHTVCACPKPGTCSPVVVVVCLFIAFVLCCLNILGRRLYFMNADTFCILGAFCRLLCGMDPGPWLRP